MSESELEPITLNDWHWSRKVNFEFRLHSPDSNTVQYFTKLGPTHKEKVAHTALIPQFFEHFNRERYIRSYWIPLLNFQPAWSTIRYARNKSSTTARQSCHVCWPKHVLEWSFFSATLLASRLNHVHAANLCWQFRNSCQSRAIIALSWKFKYINTEWVLLQCIL